MENPPLCKKLKESSPSSSSPLLELPESVLNCILEKLSPETLFKVAGVCVLLRQICRDGNDNQLWESHMKQKWRNLLSPAAYRAWSKFTIYLNSSITCLPLMYFYFALETAKFWFPAQVYNREVVVHWSRYPSHKGKAGEEVEMGIVWERVRAPLVDISPRQLYESKCIYDLQPGDHVEVQWRKYKVHPYGWWYGIVGHLETCNGIEDHCKCRNSDSVVLEFKHFGVGSRWRKAIVSRKSDREAAAGNKGGGYYGGIRKLSTPEEIATWHTMWPPYIIDI